jgi:hypothetical protein
LHGFSGLNRHYLPKYPIIRRFSSGVGTSSTGDVLCSYQDIWLSVGESIKGDLHSRTRPPLQKGYPSCPGPGFLTGKMSSLPSVRVLVPVRLPPSDLGNGNIVNPEPSESPLVLGAEPDLAGHPCRKREDSDIAEIVLQQVFVQGARVDMVPQHPDFHKHRVSRLEDMEIVRELRVVRVLLPPVTHLFSEFF